MSSYPPERYGALINGETVLAVIPARGGSKRTPRKNLKSYRGKPLLQWALEAARGSKYLDMVLVSSEDDEILALAEVLGAQTLHRPPELATDDATNEDVVRHALSVFPCSWAVLLQPTSPLRTAADIDGCIERAQMGNACITYNPHGQKNGAVYVARAEWLAKHDFSNVAHMRYIMDDSRSIDLDYPEQFNA